MNKKTETKVKTVSLPGERGPEIQYRLTAFNQKPKKKQSSKSRNILSTQITSKNVTTNIVHTEQTTVAVNKPSETTEHDTTLVNLKVKEEKKIALLENYQIKLSKEFCCSNEKDSTGSWIAGVEFVEDGHIIVLDTNNCMMKRFNTIFKFLSGIEVPLDCASMTKISNKEVAVTCLNEIHFYSIGHFGMSRSSKHFDMKGIAFGISYENSRYAVTCDIEDADKCSIRILDVFGDEIYKILPKDIVDGDVSIGTYCQIDSTYRIVAVSDFDNRYVYCFNFNGTLKWKCEIEGGPRGLNKIGKELIVSDNYGQEICAISLENGKKRILLQDEDGVFNPEFVACNHKDLRLAVTQRAFDTITIFNLIES